MVFRMWNDIVYLQTEVELIDDYNRPYKSYTDRKVFSNKKSVRQSEFYQAQAQGFKPEIIFEVRSYKGESHLKYKGIQYRILRTYVIGDTTELTVTSIVTENEYVH